MSEHGCQWTSQGKAGRRWSCRALMYLLSALFVLAALANPFMSSPAIAQDDTPVVAETETPPPTSGSIQITLYGSNGVPLTGAFAIVDAAGASQQVWVVSGTGIASPVAAGTASVTQLNSATDYSFTSAPAATTVPAGGVASVQIVNTFLDADADGVGDSVDSCPDGNDLVDSDLDGVADACDPAPNGEAPAADANLSEGQSSDDSVLSATPVAEGEPVSPGVEPAEVSAMTVEVASEEIVVADAPVSCEEVAGNTPWVVTDLPDYPPGSVVTLTGGGWTPGETIRIVVDDDGLADAVRGPWIHEATVTADAVGQFVYQFSIAPWFVRDYTVVATGECSSATTTFTDALTINSVTLNGASVISIAPGATLSVAVTLFTDGTDWHSTGWRISTTAPGTITCVNTADFNKVGTATRTFNITAPTTLGTYNAYFIAYQGGNCEANKPLSNTYVMSAAVVVTNSVLSRMTVGSATGVYGGTVNLSATLVRNSDSAPISGRTITFFLAEFPVGTATTNASGVATLNNASLAGIDVGSYVNGVEADFAGDASFSSTLAVNTLTVTLRAVTVTADAKTKVFGAVDPTLTYQITSGSLAAGDSFTGALTRVTGESLGSYAIQQGTLALTTNYTLTYVGANLTIVAAEFTLVCNPASSIVPVPGTQAINCTLTAVNLGPQGIVNVSIPAIVAPSGWTAAAPSPATGTVTQATPFVFSIALTSSCTALTTPQTVNITSNLTYGTQAQTGPATSVTVARAATSTVNVAITSASLSWSRAYAFTAYPTNAGTITYRTQASGCAGWNVTVSASAFTYSGTGAGFTISASNFTLTSSTLPAGTGLSTPVTSGPLSSSLKVLSASANNGIGTFDQTLNVNLNIPAGALVGTYRSTVTITAASGP